MPKVQRVKRVWTGRATSSSSDDGVERRPPIQHNSKNFVLVLEKRVKLQKRRDRSRDACSSDYMIGSNYGKRYFRHILLVFRTTSPRTLMSACVHLLAEMHYIYVLLQLIQDSVLSYSVLRGGKNW